MGHGTLGKVFYFLSLSFFSFRITIGILLSNKAKVCNSPFFLLEICYMDMMPGSGSHFVAEPDLMTSLRFRQNPRGIYFQTFC